MSRQTPGRFGAKTDFLLVRVGPERAERTIEMDTLLIRGRKHGTWDRYTMVQRA